MSYELSPNVERLVRERMATGHYTSEEQLLVEALAALDATDEETRAIEEGLKSVDAGDDGISADEAFTRLRRRHGDASRR